MKKAVPCIKQRTDEWNKRGKACFGGSNLYTAIRMETVKEHQLHHDQVFKGTPFQLATEK